MPLLERSVRTLLAETSAQTGVGFLRALCRTVAQVLEMRWGFVGRLVPSGGGAVQVLALWDTDHFAEPFRYDLQGTPCQVVTHTGPCCYPEGVARLFPADQLLADMGVEAYVGIPVATPAGPLGLLVALHDRPTSPPDQLQSALELFAMRAATEIQRMEATAAQEASEARYRGIVTRINQGIWIVDAAGVTVFANEQLGNMLGVPAAEMVGRTFYDFMDAAARVDAKRNLERRRAGISEIVPFRFRTADGRDRWVTLDTGPLFDDSGTFTGAMALVTDFTETRRMEERLVQSQRLEGLALLSGGIAHDFNNLLVGVLGNAEIGLASVRLSRRVRRALERIRVAANRASDLTRQLLDYAGRSEFRPLPLRLNALVRETEELLAAAISHRAALLLDLSAADPVVSGDATQLVQVLMNLITNAAHAIGDSAGQIRVRTDVVEATADLLYEETVPYSLAPGTYAVLSVMDTGRGMDELTRARMFEPFFSTKGQSGGLGLAAVLGTLRRHGAAAGVESQPGSGTTVRVYLPLSTLSPVEAPAPAEAATPVPLAGRRVLIIDDEEVVRDLVAAVLSEEGMSVAEALDGAEGLARWLEGPEPDLVILDLSMPGMPGLDVLRAAREAGRETPVVLVTGYADPATEEQAASLGVTLLRKPFSIRALTEAVGRLV